MIQNLISINKGKFFVSSIDSFLKAVFWIHKIFTGGSKSFGYGPTNEIQIINVQEENISTTLLIIGFRYYIAHDIKTGQ